MLQSGLRNKIVTIGLSTAVGIMTVTGLGAISLASASSARVEGPVRVAGVQQPGFADIVAKVEPAVVSVQVKTNEPSDDEQSFSGFFGAPGFGQLPDDHPLKRFFKDFEDSVRPQPKKPSQNGRMRPIAQGSGFFISQDGYLVTNNHVISDGTSYTVVLDDKTQLNARLIGADPRTDLAVLKVDDKRQFTYVDFSDDSKMRVGDWVVAVGNPFGLGGTVTAGIVSGRGRDIGAGVYDDFIQIDAAVNRGNSGGPAFDLNGQVVGVNTAIFSPSGGNIGIAFAIPASTAQHTVQQLIDKGSVERGWIGVQIQPVTKDIAASIGLEQAKGAIVADPMDGPAFKAGIKAGDTIVMLNGQEVSDARDLARKIANVRPNATATLGLWRFGKIETIKVKVAAMPTEKKGNAPSEPTAGDDKQLFEQFGLTVVPAEDGSGAVVTNVAPNGGGADRGIRSGDIIVAVNHRLIKNAADITKLIDQAKKHGRSAILMQVKTNHKNRFVALPLAAQ